METGENKALKLGIAASLLAGALAMSGCAMVNDLHSSNAPIRVRIAASRRSVFSSLPVASAKRRAWRGLTLTNGTPDAPSARSIAR
jgi:hypothetical protein